jgi:hypothetical protein
MTEPMEIVSVRLNPWTVRALQEITGKKVKRSDAVRGFFETYLQRLIFDVLNDKFVRGKIRIDMPHEELCRLFVNYQKLMRGERGYKAQKGKAITFHENDNETEKIKEFRQMPLKIVSIITPENKK